MRRKLFVAMVVTELSNIAVSDFDAKKSTHCKRVLVVTELVVKAGPSVQRMGKVAFASLKALFAVDKSTDVFV